MMFCAALVHQQLNFLSSANFCCDAGAMLAEKAIIKQEALFNSVPMRDLKKLSEMLQGANI